MMLPSREGMIRGSPPPPEEEEEPLDVPSLPALPLLPSAPSPARPAPGDAVPPRARPDFV